MADAQIPHGDLRAKLEEAAKAYVETYRPDARSASVVILAGLGQPVETLLVYLATSPAG